MSHFTGNYQAQRMPYDAQYFNNSAIMRPQLITGLQQGIMMQQQQPQQLMYQQQQQQQQLPSDYLRQPVPFQQYVLQQQQSFNQQFRQGVVLPPVNQHHIGQQQGQPNPGQAGGQPPVRMLQNTQQQMQQQMLQQVLVPSNFQPAGISFSQPQPQRFSNQQTAGMPQQMQVHAAHAHGAKLSMNDQMNASFAALGAPNGPHPSSLAVNQQGVYAQQGGMGSVGNGMLQHSHGHQTQSMQSMSMPGGLTQNPQVSVATSSALQSTTNRPPVKVSVGNLMEQTNNPSGLIPQMTANSGNIAGPPMQMPMQPGPAHVSLPLDTTNGNLQAAYSSQPAIEPEMANQNLPPKRQHYNQLFIPSAQTDQPFLDVPTIVPPQAPQTRRERKPISIVNPETKTAVDVENLRKEKPIEPVSEAHSSSSSIVITNPKTHEVVHVARTPHTSISESFSKLSLAAHRNDLPAESSSINGSMQVQTPIEPTNNHSQRPRSDERTHALTIQPPTTTAPVSVTAAATVNIAKADIAPPLSEPPAAALKLEPTPTPAPAPEVAEPEQAPKATSDAAATAVEVSAEPSPSSADAAPATAVQTAPKLAVPEEQPEREEGELDETQDASAGEPAAPTGDDQTLVPNEVSGTPGAEIVVERSQTGRWNYDSETLTKLRYAGIAPKLAPEFYLIEASKAGLPTKPGLYSRQSFAGQRGTAEVFIPDFVMPGSYMMQKGSPMGMQVSRGGSFQAPRGKKQPMVIEPLPSAVVKLHHAENAYVPSFVKPEVTEDEQEKLRRKLLSFLNKITPQKFRQLMIKTFDLMSAVTTPEVLESVVNLIFEKAISEPNFSVAYSHVCRHLMENSVPNPTNPDKPITFKFLLITKCQKEFEKKGGDTPLQEQIKRRQEEISQESNEERRTQLRAEMDDMTSKARRRALGNTKFIGELFKLEILTDTIVYFCLQHYLREGDDDSLECLCKLLITIGMKLESNQKFKDRFNDIFNRIRKIVDEKSCSLRLRCLLQDVLELRTNEWKPRREEGGPKTIDQIHADAQREETERAMYSQFSQIPPRTGAAASTTDYQQQFSDMPNRASNRRDRGGDGGISASNTSFTIPANVSTSKLQGAASGVTDSDSETQMPYRRGGKNANAPSSIEPATTIKLPTTTINAGDVRLGPGLPRKAWGAGSQQTQSTAAAPTATAAPIKDPRVTGKQQTAMTKQGSGGAWRSGNAPTDAQRSEWSNSRAGAGAQAEKWGTERVAPASLASRVANREQPDAAATGQSGASSSEASRDATPDRRASVPASGNTVAAAARLTEVQQAALERRTDNLAIGTGPPIDETTLTQRAVNLFTEYAELNYRLVGQVVSEIEQLSRAENFDAFVTALVNESFEQRGTERDDNNARRSCGRLLADMFSMHLLNAAVFTRGMRTVTQDAPDLEIDLPRVYDYLAELLSETIRSANSQVILHCLVEILEPIRTADRSKSTQVLVNIFKLLERRMGKDATERLWRSSELHLRSFIDDADAESLAKSSGLTFLLPAGAGPNNRFDDDPPLFGEQVAVELEQLLTTGKSNEQVIDWISANLQSQIDSSEALNVYFVRALVTAVTSACVHKSRSTSDSSSIHYSLNSEMFNTRCTLLQKFIDHKAPREVHALCALQQFDVQHDHPSGILSELFYALYGNDVISEDAFRDWYEAKDPHEAVGFGVAKTAVTKFYTYLNEADKDDD